MSDEKKYTLAESAAILLVSAPLVVLIVLVMVVPVGMALAWMRETIWNWFCAGFHLPRVGFWTMYAATLFVGLWNTPPRNLKDELYKEGVMKYVAGVLAADVVTLAIAFFVHAFIWRP